MNNKIHTIPCEIHGKHSAIFLEDLEILQKQVKYCKLMYDSHYLATRGLLIFDSFWEKYFVWKEFKASGKNYRQLWKENNNCRSPEWVRRAVLLWEEIAAKVGDVDV
jgi:hypothetical protein